MKTSADGLTANGEHFSNLSNTPALDYVEMTQEGDVDARRRPTLTHNGIHGYRERGRPTPKDDHPLLPQSIFGKQVDQSTCLIAYLGTLR